jgi:integrase
MASISTNKNGSRRLYYFNPGGERRILYLGKIPRKQAATIAAHIEAIVAAQASNSSPPLETSQWLGGVGDQLHVKLVNQGLTTARGPQKSAIVELGTFLDCYVAARGDVKKSTQTFYGHTRRCLIKYFGANKSLRDINVADAAKWKRWLATHEQLADSTVRRRCTMARQFFAEAVDDRSLDINPFGKLKGIGVQSNRDRDFFVTLEMAQKVIDACPDAEWRLIFALSRFGGLRCPSEHLALTWGDVDFATGRMTVRSAKTEHHKGKEKRVIPLFPELREYLEDARELAGDLAANPKQPIITRYRKGANLRTQLERVIGRAGLKPWPKLFQNLRSTRETELAESFPIHVVCEWIGNSQAVAKKHYLQVTATHFQVATKATQNTTQSAADRGGQGWTGKDTHPKKPLENAKTPRGEGVSSGRHKTRTCDLYGVNVAL